MQELERLKMESKYFKLEELSLQLDSNKGEKVLRRFFLKKLLLVELLSPYQKRRSATDMSGTEGSEVRVILCCVGCGESFQ